MAEKSAVAGTDVSIDTAGGTSYSVVADVKAVAVGDVTTEAGDSTHLLSTSRIMEFIGKGFINPGKLSMTLFLHFTQWGALHTALLAGTAVTIKWSAPLLTGHATKFSIARSFIIEKLGIPTKGTGDSKNPYECEFEAQGSGAATIVNGAA